MTQASGAENGRHVHADQRRSKPGLGAQGLLLTASGLALGLATGLPANAQSPAPSNTPAANPAASSAPPVEMNEVVVNGIPFRETVLPTRLSSSSAYGLDLNVMDTPRNTTLLSTTQLETVNIQDPRAFSYLTSSSYTDSAFGTPNIPRIRGQYADVFYNGMRDSFTDNGYGAPVNFDSFQNISITKGPASVIDGPGPGVGGEVDFLTKRPSLTRFTAAGSASFDSVGNNRWDVDVAGPLIKGELALLIDYSGEDSTSYFYGHFMRKNAVYVALRWTPNSAYQLDFNSEINSEQYTEEVGINRVNQNLIDHGDYLQGAPVQGAAGGSIYAALIDFGPVPVGSPGNPYSPVPPILTEVNLTDGVRINPRVTIDETPGTSTRALLYNAQIIQSYRLNESVSFENNTFFAFQDSDNQEAYYYADASRNSWSLENRTDVKFNFALPYGINNEAIAGFTFRYAYTNYISDFSAESVSVYDLTSNPTLWTYSAAYQSAYADAFTYKSPFGKTLYGVPGRDATGDGNTGISQLYDSALFFQDRITFSPAWSILFGARIDALQDHSYDPLGGPDCPDCFNTVPESQSHTTKVYGVGDVNGSVVYKPQPWISGYLTFDWTQSENPNGGEGGVNAYGQVPDSQLLRSDSYLYEAGLKLNLLDNKLFAGLAVFDQKHGIPVGLGNTQTDQANIRGVEVEANYQPTRGFYATASYSYVDTTLNTAPLFYNYPAQLGLNIDGAGLFAVFEPGQKFQDPGMPQHVFNFLGNYKFLNGFGLRSGVQVTGPIATSASGQLNEAASTLGGLITLPTAVTNDGGYYRSPVIPWQFTWNAAAFYEFSRYIVTVSVYNLTNQRNWQPSPALYGNDFLVRDDPRTFELRLQAKF